MRRKWGFILTAVAVLIVVGVIALKVTAPKPAVTASEQIEEESNQQSKTEYAPLRGHSSTGAVASVARTTATKPTSRTNFFLTITKESGRFSPEQIARYLARNGTNAQTLLAAADLTTNRLEYLKLAAQLFPDDPRVQLAIVTDKVFPEQQREWLDRLKKSDSQNAIALFLSASSHFRSGDAAAAIAELSAAGTMGGYHDYSSDRMSKMEEAYVQEGRTPAEAKALAVQSIELTQLPLYKEALADIDSLQKQYRASGDVASANAMAQIGLGLGIHLTQGEGSHLLLSQLVGAAIERRMLTQLPPDTAPPHLGMSVQERLEELDKFRRNSRDWAQEVTALFQRADEGEISAYYNYMKEHGESEAMKWLRERSGSR